MNNTNVFIKNNKFDFQSFNKHYERRKTNVIWIAHVWYDDLSNKINHLTKEQLKSIFGISKLTVIKNYCSLMYNIIDFNTYRTECNNYVSKSYVSISSNKFKDLLNKKIYKNFIGFLSSNSLIDVINSYSTDHGYTKQYRINIAYGGIEKKIFFINKMNKAQLKYFRERIMINNEKHNNNVSRIGFDFISAKVDFQRRYEKELKKGTLVESDMLNQLKIISDIECGRYNFKRCDFGRLHSSVTRLFKQYRKYFTLVDNGIKDVFDDIKINNNDYYTHTNVSTFLNIDIKNSQPNFLYKVLLDNGFDKDHEDMIKYRELLNNDMYNDILDYIKVYYTHTNVSTFLNNNKDIDHRAFIKNEFFHILFGTINDNHIISQYLKTKVPSIYKFIKEMKQYEGKDENTGFYYIEDYSLCKKRRNSNNKISPCLSRLAHYLQKAESEFMIDTIAAQLKSEGYDFLTIHDSILCPMDQSTKVFDVVRKGLNEIGLCHTKLEIESLDYPEYKKPSINKDEIEKLFLLEPTKVTTEPNSTKVDLPYQETEKCPEILYTEYKNDTLLEEVDIFDEWDRDKKEYEYVTHAESYGDWGIGEDDTGFC